ncbi:MAG: class I mannose-6-phosphate isomerase [Spirochaetes bacterium]|nr:class I mannose-6-phosphate isomerase [Spirochaetota bacterium]
MYPLLFNNILIEKVWGGRNLQNILNINLPDERLYGESWVVSDIENHLSIVQNGRHKGKSLHDLLTEYGDSLTGPGISSVFPGSFPLLVKYIDITDKLSIQVHPDDNAALKDGYVSGKHESWYVINASSDAEIIAGLKPGISKNLLINMPYDKIRDYYNVIKVKTGDFLNIEPGTVHATYCGSILVCEIQQNSDITYRIYDYDREYNGAKRELQIEKGIETIIEKNSVRIIHTDSKSGNDKNRADILTENKFYSIYKLRICNKYIDPVHKNFKIFSAISGNGILKCGSQSYTISTGMTYLLPAGLNVEICGRIEILKSYL